MTNRKHPSEAAHQITLKVGEQTDTLTFPFPFNATEIHTSSSEAESSPVQLVLMKSINEPHPEEWQTDHQVRWNLNTLEEWDALRLAQDLNFHLSAQFEFADLKRQMLSNNDADQQSASEQGSGLRGVREIIRTIFQSTILDGNRFVLFFCGAFFGRHFHEPIVLISLRLYVIRCKDDPKLKNLWFLRVHLPVRKSPLGSPLLMLTANDHRLAQKLVDRGGLDQSKATDDFKRIFVDGESSSTGVCPIFVQSDEEESLLRYLLRTNATKLLQQDDTPWPVKDVPVGEDSPWLTTFISPSYIDQAGTDAEMEDLVATTKRITTTAAAAAVDEPNTIPLQDAQLAPMEACSKCLKMTEGLKRCSRCKSVKYCSIACQRADWSAHKSSCV